jgi:hypothetical protein
LEQKEQNRTQKKRGKDIPKRNITLSPLGNITNMSQHKSDQKEERVTGPLR